MIQNRLLLVITLVFSIAGLLSAQHQLESLQIENAIAPINSETANLALAFDPDEPRSIVLADFQADKTIIESGSVVKFTSLSTGEPNFFKWSFPGASPATAYNSSPLVIYHTPGIYDVTLFVSGINGSDEITKESFIEVLTQESELPPDWDYPSTTSQHVIAITLQSNPAIFEIPIDSGDYIGVFQNNYENILKCAGATMWTGTGNVVIVAQGDDWITPNKDGFMPGEIFKWKIYSMRDQEEYPAKASYDPMLPMQQYFIPSGISALTTLYAGVVYNITLSQGWSGISSPVLPWNKDFDQIFSSAPQNIIMLYNEGGMYWPAEGINTLGEWENKGYFTKFEAETEIEIKGYPVESPILTIQPGWNMLPILTDCDVAITELLQNNIGDVTIIREIAGLKMYWPEHEIFSLNLLSPGKAYLLFADDGFVLEFPVCE